ncbi:mpv17-like protein 2 [Belonocnema kinseyi]|uniref:mpv17-like protein 2 n=1 Tax=Belonocnema kinseyi TaxID=2817044 RepID=UPI00143CC2EC|nr:mpv17-like protein 2 [Belonocnema kinseyi]
MGIFSKLFGKYLLITNTASCGLMMAVADVIHQQGELFRQNRSTKVVSISTNVLEQENGEDKKVTLSCGSEHDFTRTRNMLTVGLLQGPFHHYFYKFLEKSLPGTKALSVLKKTFADQMLSSPTCIAIFFFGHGFLERRNLKEINEEVQHKFLHTWKVDWCFFPPAQMVNFLYVPVQYRVLYINMMTMLFDIFLSYVKYEAEFTH